MCEAWRARSAFSVALLALVASCATAPHPGARAPIHLGDGEVVAIAELIRLEDRREFDPATIGQAAAAGHPELRRRAALAMGRLRESASMPLLVRLLADGDTAVSATAAFAMGLMGDTAAVPHLAGWLVPDRAARQPTVAGEAASSLGKLPSRAAAVTLESFLAAAPVTSGRDPAVENALLAIWRHPRGDDETPILRWTEAEHPEVRWRAVYALVRRPDARAAPRLLQLASDPDARVRALAVRGITAPLADSAGIPRQAAMAAALSLSEGPDRGTAVNAVRTLATFADEAVVLRLVALLDADPALAVAAAESLGRLGSAAARASDALSEVALDGDRAVGVRSAALQALVAVSRAHAVRAAAHIAGEPGWRMRAAAARALAALDSAPTVRVEALVRDPDPRVGAAALAALAAAVGDSAAPIRTLLIESLGASDVQLRVAALGGLATLRDPATMPAVLDAFGRALADPKNDAALGALDALGVLAEAGAPAARSLAQRFARPDDYLVRQRALARFGDPIRAAWADPLPIETGCGREHYLELVRTLVAPELAGAAPRRVRIDTEAGAIEMRLFAADAPLTVASFLDLAGRGYFDGQEWPRVVPNFVIQGGDPRGDQTGGPGYAIRDEFNRHRYLRGTLGMALSGPDTGGSQFFITHSPQPHLDGGYTIFGEVFAGMDVVDRVVAGERILRVREQ